MKYQSLLLGIVLVQACTHNAAAKPLSLYRIEGNNERKIRQLAHEVPQSAESVNEEHVEDFSDELYDEPRIPNERMLYQSEEEKMIQERRDMFSRNLVSMSVSMSISFTVIEAPPGPPLFESGDEEESTYDMLRDKLLGDDATDEDDEASIDRANDLASTASGEVSGLMLTEVVETESDYLPVDTKDGYVALRTKLLGKGGDEQFDETVDEDITLANELASKKDIVGGGPKKNLRQR